MSHWTAKETLNGLGALIAVMVATANPAPAQAQTMSTANRLHGHALDSFRQGRFPEAYGRFISLADAGHPASAQYALWMCEHGPQLFGKEWDCSGEQVQDWAQLAGTAVPPLMARRYGLNTVATSRSRAGRPGP